MKRILMVFVSIIFIMFLVSCNEEEKVEQINIKFVIEENIYDIKKEVNYIVNIADIPNITEEDIEGIYYDSGYSSKYNNEQIKEDTVLYVKMIDKYVEVAFIIEDEKEVISIKKNTIVRIEDITSCDKEDIEGIYYDSEYSSVYNGEKIDKDIIIYVKLLDLKSRKLNQLDRYLKELESKLDYSILFIEDEIEYAKEEIEKETDENRIESIYNYAMYRVNELILTTDEENELKQIIYNFYIDKTIIEYRISDIKIHYYLGKFSDSYVLEINDPISIIDSYIMIGPYSFKNDLIFTVYNNGQRYSLKKAYEMNLITLNDLDTIYLYYSMIKQNS